MGGEGERGSRGGRGGRRSRREENVERLYDCSLTGSAAARTLPGRVL